MQNGKTASLSTPNQAPSTKHQAPSTKHQAPSTKHQAPTTCNLQLATSNSTEADLPIRIITPHNGLDAFKDAYRSIIRDWPQTQSLAWRLFLRDTRAAYRSSFLGYVWLLLPALASTLVWVFLNSQDVVNIDSGDVPYPLFVFTGTVLWTAFNGALNGAMGIIQEAGGTLSKVNFPHEALLLNALWKSLLNSAATAIFLIPFLILFPVPLTWHLLLFPIGLFVIMLFGLAVGLIIVPIGALFNDLTRAIHLGLRFLFFLTPVIFPLPASGLARTLFQLNPVTPLLVSTRGWLIGGEPTMPIAFIALTCLTLFLLAIGTIIFKVALPHIIERLSG